MKALEHLLGRQWALGASTHRRLCSFILRSAPARAIHWGLRGYAVYKGKKVIVVMPAYNAEKTLRQTYDEVMAQGLVDLVIVVDDASADRTVAIADTLPEARLFTHAENRGSTSPKVVGSVALIPYS